jgi:hypothetical protein
MALRSIGLALICMSGMGCAHVQFAGPPSYATTGLTVTVESIEYDDDKLELKLMFVNNTDKIMIVNRDLLGLKLPDGSVRTRDNGEFFGIPTASTYAIPPHASHAVHVNYKIPETTPQAALQMVGITVDGQPAAFPDFVVTRSQR